ncbi:MAG: precorrin-6A synthase (deacetylating) [Hyphomicrobiaceae bacterium]|nr:precorrin-6A synthase (deacetylating) [Hyphomicrobiaceae bacterium]
MRRILLIGIGTGDPAFVTMQAVTAINAADAFFVFDKGDDKAELIAVRQAILDRYATRKDVSLIAIGNPPRETNARYLEGVDAWHEARAVLLREAFHRHVPADGCGAFLVWGDPAIYDSTLRVVTRALAGMDDAPEIEIVPGISSIQILAARHRIGLNDIGEPILVTTGRQLREQGMPAPGVSVVVMLDGELACRELLGQGLTIYWGAALGGPDERLIAGALDDVIGDIVEARAKLRKQYGWVMDTYLLRRPAEPKT